MMLTERRPSATASRRCDPGRSRRPRRSGRSGEPRSPRGCRASPSRPEEDRQAVPRAPRDHDVEVLVAVEVGDAEGLRLGPDRKARRLSEVALPSRATRRPRRRGGSPRGRPGGRLAHVGDARAHGRSRWGRCPPPRARTRSRTLIRKSVRVAVGARAARDVGGIVGAVAVAVPTSGRRRAPRGEARARGWRARDPIDRFGWSLVESLRSLTVGLREADSRHVHTRGHLRAAHRQRRAEGRRGRGT